MSELLDMYLPRRLKGVLENSRRLDQTCAIHTYTQNLTLWPVFRTYTEPKIGSLNAMILMGQDVGLSASYNKPNENMLLEVYLKAVDNLTIDKTRTKQQQQDKKMVDFATKQQALAAQLETKDQEMQGLRKQTQILTEAYKSMEERRETKDQEIQALRNELLETKATQQKKDSEMQVLKGEIEEIRRLYEDLIKRNITVTNYTKEGVEIERFDGFGNRISSPTSAPH